MQQREIGEFVHDDEDSVESVGGRTKVEEVKGENLIARRRSDGVAVRALDQAFFRSDADKTILDEVLGILLHALPVHKLVEMVVGRAGGTMSGKSAMGHD